MILAGKYQVNSRLTTLFHINRFLLVREVDFLEAVLRDVGSVPAIMLVIGEDLRLRRFGCVVLHGLGGVVMDEQARIEFPFDGVTNQKNDYFQRKSCIFQIFVVSLHAKRASKLDNERL